MLEMEYKKEIITIRVTDTESGLINYEYIRSYDLRLNFRSERDVLHRALDDLIDKVRNYSSEQKRYSLEFINKNPYQEAKLPF